MPPPHPETWLRATPEGLHCLPGGFTVDPVRPVDRAVITHGHADWAELNRTVDEVGAPEVWVTHGRDDALIHAMAGRGIRGRALHLIGLGDDEEDAAPGGGADAGEHAASAEGATA